MGTHDWGWYQRTFDNLFGFMYIHYVNTVLKPEAMRANPWDWYVNEFHGPSYNSFGAYNLMASYAIETVIKCCLDNAGWNKNYEHHRLSDLANDLALKWDFQLQPTIVDDLSEFQEYIEWKGKYPTPKSGKSGNLNALEMGQRIYDKVRQTWSFFFNELRKHDSVLADVYLKRFIYDSKSIQYNNMEMFDVVAEIAKVKLSGAGQLLQVSDG